MPVEVLTENHPTLPVDQPLTPAIIELRDRLYGEGGYDHLMELAAIAEPYNTGPKSGLTEAEEAHQITQDFLEICPQWGRIEDLVQDVPSLVKCYEAGMFHGPGLYALMSGHGPLTTGAILRTLQNESLPEDTQAYCRELLDRLNEGRALGVFLLTEPECGTNAMAITTTAKYDSETQEWELNGVKWMPNTGDKETPVVGMVAARIIETDESGQDQDRGVSLFVVPLHSPDSPEGITVERLGDTPGIPMDNAMTTFDKVHLPKHSWMPGPHAWLDEKGKHQSELSSPRARYRDAIEKLGAGRAGLAAGAAVAAVLETVGAYNIATQRKTLGDKEIIAFDIVSNRMVSAVVRAIGLKVLSNTIVEQSAANPEELAFWAMAGKAHVTSGALELMDQCTRNTGGARHVFNEASPWRLAVVGADIAEGERDVLQMAAGRIPRGILDDETDRAARQAQSQGEADSPETWYRLVEHQAAALASDPERSGSPEQTAEIARAFTGAAALQCIMHAANITRSSEAKDILKQVADMYALEEIARSATAYAETRPDVVGVVRKQLIERRKAFVKHLSVVIKAFGIPEGLNGSPMMNADYATHPLTGSYD